jgi:hypothetical protein
MMAMKIDGGTDPNAEEWHDISIQTPMELLAIIGHSVSS